MSKELGWFASIVISISTVFSVVLLLGAIWVEHEFSVKVFTLTTGGISFICSLYLIYCAFANVWQGKPTGEVRNAFLYSSAMFFCATVSLFFGGVMLVLLGKRQCDLVLLCLSIALLFALILGSLHGIKKGIAWLGNVVCKVFRAGKSSKMGIAWLGNVVCKVFRAGKSSKTGIASLSEFRKFFLGMSAVSVLMLFIALSGGRYSAGFYTFLRIVVCAAFMGNLFKKIPFWQKFICVMGGILYNPLLPIHLGSRLDWAPFNFSAIILLILFEVVACFAGDDNGSSETR